MQQELGLVAENARLVADAQQERERQRNAPPSTAAARPGGCSTETDENARLRKELDEARAKLEAIANIERSIPARPPAEARNREATATP